MMIPSYPAQAKVHTDIAPAQVFDVLENQVISGLPNETHCIDAYLDAGLELALSAGQRGYTRMQESWLRRVYTTLRNAGLDSTLPHAHRERCLDTLHQAFFALRHLYLNRPGGYGSLRALTREMQLIGRYIL